ncbi:hypothetical protein KIPB_011505 [Kipferlia bialata]|uniref:Uncharacterized protein n=1 Tax=Kipferlia bialata TaxID=797122 RepID=A0A9K3D4Y1_9EUKA|nr:hypothetical protein KIPB_011505 [Kipferlia bialata]|eukprot:g11505.t1
MVPAQLNQILTGLQASQPSAGLCADRQTFHVVSQIGYARSNRQTFEPFGATDMLAEDFNHYATSFNSISYVESSTCQTGTQVTAATPLTVSVERQFSTEAIVVDFLMPTVLDVLESYVFLFLSLLAFHWIVMAVLRPLRDKHNVKGAQEDQTQTSNTWTAVDSDSSDSLLA